MPRFYANYGELTNRESVFRLSAMDDASRRRKQRRERGTYQKFDPIGSLMNSEAVLGIIRHVITTAGGALVANGTIDANQLNT